ncbi:TlpA disulfide reductase family protein [Candidatus Sarmatiella mevalonica]|uniref:TlpA disulfide reductase family protein n=1 Tax=Candidatus Sarmatiella mevalonica TaxID=2770581 RepID=UPI001921E2C5|nr:TlpA disulfide reductase family protein [Candidatus Sarmatiella mevalonica]
MTLAFFTSFASYLAFYAALLVLNFCFYSVALASDSQGGGKGEGLLVKIPLDPIIKAESISFLDLDGKSRYLYQFEGKVTLLLFWATWSVACTSDLEKLDNLQKDFRKLPFEILAIVVDSKDLSFIKQYVDAQHFSHLKIYLDPKKQLFKLFEVTSLPTAFLISSNGEVLYKFAHNPQWNYDQVRNIILSHIGDGYVLPFNSYQPRALNNKPKVVKEILRTEEANAKDGAKDSRQDEARGSVKDEVKGDVKYDNASEKSTDNTHKNSQELNAPAVQSNNKTKNTRQMPSAAKADDAKAQGR